MNKSIIIINETGPSEGISTKQQKGSDNCKCEIVVVVLKYYKSYPKTVPLNNSKKGKCIRYSGVLVHKQNEFGSRKDHLE